MKQPEVLVIADQGSFAQALMGRWKAERVVPSFTLLGSDVFRAEAAKSCDLVIAGAVDLERMPTLAGILSELTPPVIVLAGDGVDVAALARYGRIMVLRHHDEWLDVLMLLATECLRRAEMTERAHRAEAQAQEAAAQATLGRYMLDMRHSLNNALTSVLGNAELLLLEPGNLTDDIRDQLTTIRTMSLRMNEILSRFSSLDLELKFARREVKSEPAAHVRTTAAGWTSF